MSDKKNIDRLFQERFKDFESVPNEKIWNNIQDALHKKKQRRIIPLWWKLSGIAAGFVLAILVLYPFIDTVDEKPAVVVTPKENENSKQNKVESNTSTETRIAVGKDASSVKEDNSIENDLNSSKTKIKVAINDANSSENENESKENSNQNIQSKNVKVNKVTDTRNKLNSSKSTAVANNFNTKNESELDEKSSTLKEKKAEINNSSSDKVFNKNQLANENNKAKIDDVFSKENNNSLNKNTILKDIDSTATTLASEPNPLEEILKKKNEKGEEVLATAKLNRWQVTTNVAPVYFNSASNGSPIESQFKENSKSYENNLSVGVGVQYAVNKRLTVRTGVNKVTLGYATNDVVFFGALNSPGFSTLNADLSTSNIEVFSAYNTEGLRPFEDNSQNMESGVLNQKMGYYEVPMELSYAILNRKFGIQVIGGLSTLFLNENTVSVQSSSTTMSLGKASNLNNIHFSSNIGLGFKYKFFKSLEAHFEPTFKYQFNTFSRNDGNFKPYFVGLYTGVSFKF